MNKREVAILLTEVAVTDKRTVGSPDVEAWAAVLGAEVPFDFARAAALAHFRERPDVWLAPGHIYERWRAHRRDQLAREDEELRAARQAALDARNVADLGVAELAASKGLPVQHYRRSEQPGGNALTVPCPWCRQVAGHGCRVPNTTTPTTNPHPSRVEAAARNATKEAHA